MQFWQPIYHKSFSNIQEMVIYHNNHPLPTFSRKVQAFHLVGIQRRTETKTVQKYLQYCESISSNLKTYLQNVTRESDINFLCLSTSRFLSLYLWTLKILQKLPISPTNGVCRLDKPARLIVRLLFGFVSDSETSVATP